jgi:uncharacterized membrane protein
MAGGISHIFRWTSAGGMQDLGTLPGGLYDYANGISGDGLAIVGADSAPGINRAFLWRPALGRADLNTYLPAIGVDLTGWTLYAANRISEDGTAIVGEGSFNGQPRGWIVTAIPEPIAAPSVVFAFALVRRDGRRRR